MGKTIRYKGELEDFTLNSEVFCIFCIFTFSNLMV